MRSLFEHFILGIMGSVKGLLSNGHQAITGIYKFIPHVKSDLQYLS